MNIRPKTVRRLVGLGLFLLLSATLFTGIWFYHQKNKQKQLLADRDFGIAAYRAGDYPLAVDRLRIYKDLHPDDYDAVFAYAVSRLRTASSSNSGLRSIATRSASGRSLTLRYVGWVMNGCSDDCRPKSIPVGRLDT